MLAVGIHHQHMGEAFVEGRPQGCKHGGPFPGVSGQVEKFHTRKS